MVPYGTSGVEQSEVRNSEVTSNSKKASKSRTKRARAVTSSEKSNKKACSSSDFERKVEIKRA